MQDRSESWWAESWLERMPWLIIPRALRLAVQFRMLAIATLGLLLTLGGWWLLGAALERWAPDVVLPEGAGLWPPGSVEQGDAVTRATTSQADPGPSNLWSWRAGWSRLGSPLNGSPVLAVWELLGRPLRSAFRLDLRVSGFLPLLAAAIWAALVWAFCGGALVRMAALEFTSEERLAVRPALAFARQKWSAFFWSPFYPVIGAAVIGLPAIALGWMLRFPVANWLAIVIWPLLLICGLLMSIILLGLLIGWPLMWATIGVEGTDTFDALSRSYAYCFQRPLRLLIYIAVASVVGAFGWLIVALFGWATVHLTFWAASWSAGHETIRQIVRVEQSPQVVAPPSNAGGPILAAADGSDAAMTTTAEERPPSATAPAAMTSGALGVLRVWVELVRAVVGGFAFSFFWASAVAIYLVLRHDVDATPMDEVYLAEEPIETDPLPQLRTDSTGAPEIVESSESADSGDREADATAQDADVATSRDDG